MKNKTFRKVIEYILVIALAILLAFNYIIFIVHNRFAPSGINGIATLLEHSFGFSIGYFSLIVNVPLSILAFFTVNREFAIKSFIFTLTYSITYLILQNNITLLTPFVYDAGGNDVIIPVLAASIISGFIYGMSFKINSSTGGTDIIAKVVSRYHPEISLIWFIFAMNVLVALASYFVYGEFDPETNMMKYDLKPVILCIFYSFMSSIVSSRILSSGNEAIKFEIITPHGDDIEQDIFNELHHGVTKEKVEGGYSKQQLDKLICVVNKHQLINFERILKRYPDTFAYIQTVSKTLGNFKRIK